MRNTNRYKSLFLSIPETVQRLHLSLHCPFEWYNIENFEYPLLLDIDLLIVSETV